MTERLRGIVIETFGAGNIPGDGGALLPIIEKGLSQRHGADGLLAMPAGSGGARRLRDLERPEKRAGAVSGWT